MRVSFFLSTFLVILFGIQPGFAQGDLQVGVPFLMKSPGAESNAMGLTSVANVTGDPLASIMNPAQLGMQSLTTSFSGGYDYAKWYPNYRALGFSAIDSWFRNYALIAGINLKKAYGIEPVMSVGLGYSNVHFYEAFPPASYSLHESSNQYTLGIGLDYWLRGSFGITYRRIVSDFGVIQGRDVTASVGSYDYGLMLEAPMVGILSRLQGAPVEFVPGLSPFFNLTLGLSRNNLGDNGVWYVDPAQADPLPRYARIGMGINFGVEWQRGDQTWRVASFKWLNEANDILFKRYPGITKTVTDTSTGQTHDVVVSEPYWEYRTGLGSIQFANEVLFGGSNPSTVRKRGWEINLGQIVLIRGGRYDEGTNIEFGNEHCSTSGYSLRFSGLAKAILIMSPDMTSGGVWDFLLRHVDVQYSHSQITTDDPRSIYNGTSYDSGSIVISN